MQIDKLIHINNIKCELFGLNYEYIGNKQGEYKINLEQSIGLVDDYNFDEFRIVVQRKVKLEPEELFKIYVALMITYTIDKEKTADEFLNDKDLLKQHLEEKLNEFYNVSGGDAYLSSIVSQITSWFGNKPLILPPSIERGSSD